MMSLPWDLEMLTQEMNLKTDFLSCILFLEQKSWKGSSDEVTSYSTPPPSLGSYYFLIV